MNILLPRCTSTRCLPALLALLLPLTVAAQTIPDSVLLLQQSPGAPAGQEPTPVVQTIDSAQFQAVATKPGDSTKCPVKSIPDLLRKKDSLAVVKPTKSKFFILIPVIGSQPATGFMFGATAQYTFKGKDPNDRFSSINVSATYTTKKQVLINFKNNVFLKQNKIFLSGDWRFYIFSQSNYGLGSDILPPTRNNKSFDIDSIAQPMEYNYVKVHQTISWVVRPNFYVGVGLHLDGYMNIEDLNLDTANGRYTYAYNYNRKYDFKDDAYYVNGVSLNLLFDSRDNQINANHGWYWNLNYRFNPDFGRNSAESNILFAELRHFIPLSKYNKQHVLGFWAYGQFLPSGRVPYLNLPALGWDQRSRGGMGYTQGLIRGFNYVYSEAEYRFPITCNQLISGTFFVGFSTASDDDRGVKLFSYLQPATGIGLRILLDKATRTNFLMNYAWGRHSSGFYLNAGEVF